MADTTFVDNSTVIVSDWLNDVNSITYKNVINPTNSQFGAVGDGITDDTAALQSAITHAISLISTNTWSPDSEQVYVEIDGQGKQYLVSSPLNIGDGAYGLKLSNFSLIAGDSFVSNTGTITINHDTGYITPSGTLKAIINFKASTKSKSSRNTLENITIRCRSMCDGIYQTNSTSNRYNNVMVTGYKRYGFRFYGAGANTETKLIGCVAKQWSYSEAEVNDHTAVGMSFETADMMIDQCVAAHNAVNMYFEKWGSHSVGRTHNYNHYIDNGDESKFPRVTNATNSGVLNTTSSGNKIRIDTNANHNLTTGDRVFVGYLPGISNNGGLTGKWTTVTVQDANTVDLDETLFAGAYVAPSWIPTLRPEVYQPISMWIAPSVAAFWANATQLDGTTIRCYSSHVMFNDVFASANNTVQRTGYPWFDYRAIAASDTLDGLTVTNVTKLNGQRSLSLYAQGSGSIVEPYRCNISGILEQGGTVGASSGYAQIAFSTNITETSATGLTGAETGTATIDGQAIALSASTLIGSTLLNLCDYLQNTVSAAGKSIDYSINGSTDRITIYSNTVGASSTVVLSGTIFTALTGFSSLPTPVDGLNSDAAFTRGKEFAQVIGYGSSATNPAYVFSMAGDEIDITAGGIDRNSGMFSPGEDQVAMAVGGLEAWRTVMVSSGITSNYINHTSGIPISGVQRQTQFFSSDATRSGVSINHFSATAGQNSSITLAASKNSTIGDTQAAGALLSGDTLGRVIFAGNDTNGAIANGATISAMADGDYSANRPTKLVFGTNLGTTTVSHLQINKDGHTAPFVTNTYDLGLSGSLSWRNIYSQNAVTVTSDIRTKKDIVDSQLGLSFIEALRPVSYTFITGGNEHTVEVVEHAEYDGTGECIKEEVTKDVVTPTAGKRIHYGLIAQEVKAACDTIGVDFGGWVKSDINDPDSLEMLRYEEFIAPLIKAVQELSSRVKQLENK